MKTYKLIAFSGILTTALTSTANGSTAGSPGACDVLNELAGQTLECTYNGVVSKGAIETRDRCENQDRIVSVTLRAFGESLSVTGVSKVHSSYFFVTDLADLPIKCSVK